ncbi:MAG: hemerythrin family protein [Sterolibacterium sp.]
MIKWDSRYELGNEQIDSEHRTLLGLISDFGEAAKQGATKEKLVQILDEISTHAEYHFSSEEKIMTGCQYPEQKSHALLHLNLMEDLIDKFWKFKRGAIMANEVFQFLFEWFEPHVLIEDKKLVEYVGN